MGELSGAVLMFVGASLAVVSAIGIHRFGSPLARAHAAGKAAPVAVVLVAIGALVHGVAASAGGRIALAAALVVITSPIGVHVLARAIRRVSDGHVGPEAQGVASRGRYRS